jgi:hypothetical protein
MSSWAPTKYKTKNWSSCNDSLKQRGSLSIWFDPEMVWTPLPNGKRGRQQQFSDAAIQTCLTTARQALQSNVPRGAEGPVWHAASADNWVRPEPVAIGRAGLDRAAPDFSTLCRRQRTLNVGLSYSGCKGPLHLLIDSTGIKAEGEGEWNARKHGGPKRRIHCRAVDERRSDCPKRSGQCAAISEPHLVATLERIPPPKPRRNEDALHETTWPIADGEGLLSAGCRNPRPHRRPKPLHGSWHTRH